MTGINPPPHCRDDKSTDVWITPQWLLDVIGPFDLDPCAAMQQPWPCAARSFTEAEDGLLRQWKFDDCKKPFVFCNPPYGRRCGDWLGRLSLHNHGIALTFARTETRMFFQHVWPKASCLLFISGRVTFHREDGSRPRMGNNAGGPSVLIGYGSTAMGRLVAVHHLGQLVVPARFK